MEYVIDKIDISSVEDCLHWFWNCIEAVSIEAARCETSFDLKLIKTH